ncbi:molybdopterin cofactor-binding domain-containing protein [Novosphingobium sp.]|uniref:xanthine dehydrogenase family protein molybdopterin-binding subunit n=1 Tax=Novosphingobium sp. TaxID=1874826 RepID=UPI0038BA36E6
MRASRRQFIAGSSLAAGALAVPVLATQAATPAAKALAANTWLGVGLDGKVTLALPKTEMGQGILTAVTMIAAEELAVAPADVVVTLANGDKERFAPISQETGGSTSIRELWQPLREAGAKARAALVQAAAAQWKVSAAECHAFNGAVVHQASGKVLPYAALVTAAAAAPLPTEAPVLGASDYKVIGKPHRRLDGAAKARGKAEFGIDVIVPGMKFAAIVQSPVFGGTLATANEAAAKAVPGVVAVVKVADALYVVADNTWAAKQGIAAAAPTWTANAAHKATTHAQITGAVAAALDKPGFAAVDNGDLAKARTGAKRTFSAEYHQAFLAHATMEPANCVAQVKDGACTVWTGTQVPSVARDAAAKALGFALDKVTVHNRLMGGGFGRRLETDMVERAVQLAAKVPWPVKLIWSREEDIAHDWYRPAYADRFNVALDAEGKPVAWEHKIAGSSIMARLMGPAFKGVDDDVVDGLTAPLYEVPARKVTFQQAESLVPTSWWRGVGPLRTAFAVESLVDELAHELGRDAIEYRLALITDPRARHALETVRVLSDWNTKQPAGTGLGVAVIHNWDTYMAAVAQVSVGADKQIVVKKVTVAVDCGQAINPSGIRAQIDSGVLFGGSAALFGEVTFNGGAAEQSNFHDYRVLRMNEAPRIETTLITSTEKPGGMGEPPCAVIFPALANAVFAATGKRLRTLPLQKALESV